MDITGTESSTETSIAVDSTTISENMCVICMESPSEIKLTCQHEFCFRCIYAWHFRKVECPLCRAPITPTHFNESKETIRESNHNYLMEFRRPNQIQPRNGAAIVILSSNPAPISARPTQSTRAATRTRVPRSHTLGSQAITSQTIVSHVIGSHVVGSQTIESQITASPPIESQPIESPPTESYPIGSQATSSYSSTSDTSGQPTISSPIDRMMGNKIALSIITVVYIMLIICMPIAVVMLTLGFTGRVKF